MNSQDIKKLLTELQRRSDQLAETQKELKRTQKSLLKAEGVIKRIRKLMRQFENVWFIDKELVDDTEYEIIPPEPRTSPLEGDNE